MKMKIIIFLLLIFSNLLFACECVSLSIPENYINSKYVTEIEVLNIYGNNISQRNYKAEIKILKKFKGDLKKETLIIDGIIGDIKGTACEMQLLKGQKLLLFQNDNDISISSCTPHIDLNDNYSNKLKALQELFIYLDKNDFSEKKFIYFFENNKNGKSSLSKIKNLNPYNRFALYQVNFNNSKIESVQIISEFGNQDDKIRKLIENNLQIFPQPNESNQKLIIVLFYIPNYFKNQSVIPIMY